jgi:transcriptional regulator with XRE-family HTH domain
MEPDYARAFRIIRAAFGLKQSELTARMSISVSQLSLIEAGKRNATPKVIEALARATRVPVELIEVLAASREDVGGKSTREIAETARVLLKLLVPDQRATPTLRLRKTG